MPSDCIRDLLRKPHYTNHETTHERRRIIYILFMKSLFGGADTAHLSNSLPIRDWSPGGACVISANVSFLCAGEEVVVGDRRRGLQICKGCNVHRASKAESIIRQLGNEESGSSG